MKTLVLEIIEKENTGGIKPIKRIKEKIYSTPGKAEKKLLEELGELKVEKCRIENRKRITVKQIGRFSFYFKIKLGVKIFTPKQIKEKITREKDEERRIMYILNEERRIMHFLFD